MSMLLINFLISIIICVGVALAITFILRHPLKIILNRITSDNTAAAWSQLIFIVIFLASFLGGFDYTDSKRHQTELFLERTQFFSGVSDALSLRESHQALIVHLFTLINSLSAIYTLLIYILKALIAIYLIMKLIEFLTAFCDKVLSDFKK